MSSDKSRRYAAQFSCSKCGYAYSKMVSTNKDNAGAAIRRRRVCLKCEAGFVTYEVTAGDYAVLQALRKWSNEVK